MRAVRVAAPGGVDVLRVQSTPIPVVTPKTVLIKVKAIGINPVETYIRAGNYAKLPAFPYTPGNDAAGIVEQVGEGTAHRINVGAKVYCTKALSGAYAEYVLAEEEHVHPIPATLTLPQAAALGIPYYTAYRALFHCGAGKAGHTVLVHGGTGGVGIACLQLAKAAGMTVIGSASSISGQELIRPWCDAVVSHGGSTAASSAGTDKGAVGTGVAQGPTAPIVDAVLAATGGRGADIILEMRGDLNLAHDTRMIAQGGRIVVIGNRGEVTLNAREIMSREAVVTGVMLWHATPEDWARAEAHIHAGCESGALVPCVGITFPGLEQAGEAHEEVIGHGRTGGSKGKVVITLE